MPDINESPVKATVQKMFKLMQSHGNTIDFWYEVEKLIKVELAEVVDLKKQLAAKDARIEALVQELADLGNIIHENN